MFFIHNLFDDPYYFFSSLLLVVFSICTHEFVHAWAALREGDTTAADAGHLTFNPFVQMGVWSLIMFLLCGIAWGQVPVNPSRMRHGRRSAAWVALSGPLSNFGVFLIFSSVAAVGYYFESEGLWQLMARGAVLNVILAVLNLLPIPGLDGWAVVVNYFPRLLAKVNNEVLAGVTIGLVLLLFIKGFVWLEYLGYWGTGLAVWGWTYGIDWIARFFF